MLQFNNCPFVFDIRDFFTASLCHSEPPQELLKKGCCYFSDMKYADEAAKKKYAFIIETQYPAEAVSLWEWIDALDYLAGSAPESTWQAARDKLLRLLHNST